MWNNACLTATVTDTREKGTHESVCDMLCHMLRRALCLLCLPLLITMSPHFCLVRAITGLSTKEGKGNSTFGIQDSGQNFLNTNFYGRLH